MTDEDQIDLNQPYDIEEGIAQAKKTFSLTDRIKGVSHRVAKVLIFTDEPAVDEYAGIRQNIRDHEIRQSAISGVDSLAAEFDTLSEEIADLQEELEDAREKMLAKALSFHLRGTSKERIKIVQRKGRKIYADKHGNVPPERVEEFSDYLLTGYLELTLLKVVDAEGAEAEFDRNGLHDLVVGTSLPPSQSKRLEDAVNVLVNIDGYEQAATEDPGF